MQLFEFDPPAAKQNYKITILVGSSDSWILPWARILLEIIGPYHNAFLCANIEDIHPGEMAFLLGCTKIIPPEYLKRNPHNFVVHESDLPKGRGWSPVAWQILNGQNDIPVVLFEAREELDSGPIYLRSEIKLNGTELLPEIREKQGRATIRLILDFLNRWPDIFPVEQAGTSTYYRRRTFADDEIDPTRAIIDNFNQLRIVNNDHYPAWFKYRGQKYILKIYKDQ
jgi:methionyl-tRNA formyltransferase